MPTETLASSAVSGSAGWCRSCGIFAWRCPLSGWSGWGLFLLRLSDRLVRKHAGLLNRNIVLFEPYHAQRPESGDRHRLAALRSEQEHVDLDGGRPARPLRSPPARRRASWPTWTSGSRCCRPMPSTRRTRKRGAPKDARSPSRLWWTGLIQLSPERLIDRMGPGFVTSADRYLRLLDVPGLRRMPVIRNLVAYRQKSPAEAVTLAANYLGHLIQRFLDMVYFLADLQGTLSPPVFLDRLGATIVNATRTPAKRLLWMGSAFLLLFLVVKSVPLFQPFRGFVDQAAEPAGLASHRSGRDLSGLLAARFLVPQDRQSVGRLLRAGGRGPVRGPDQEPQVPAPGSGRRVPGGTGHRPGAPPPLVRRFDARDLSPPDDADRAGAGGKVLFENRELIFLRNIRLLYQDYLDGSPFHRSDTKASVQLLGNLALTNLRRSHLGHLLREGRALDRLDLNRAGGLFGGPYLWFTYITRMIVQETAILLLDYNRHAIPLDRLSCSPPESRRGFQELAGPPAADRARGGLAPRSRLRVTTRRGDPVQDAHRAAATGSGCISRDRGIHCHGLPRR